MTEFKNQVFDRLGAGGDDIEALTAYALYKRHKRKWAHEFETINGKLPGPDDEKQFAVAVTTDDQLERYRKDARDILIAFANQTVQEARPQIEAEAITVRIEQAADKVTTQGSVLSQVVVGIISSAIMTVLLIILAIGIRLFGIDLVDALRLVQPATGG